MIPKPVPIYSDEKMERLHQGALRVLRETGFRVDHESFLNLFEETGNGGKKEGENGK
jgi:trimethylamine:corrinoid methyltransferase-like protein